MAALGGVLLVSRAGSAQHARIHGIFTGSVGFTDNILSTPEVEASTPEEERIYPEADGYGVVSPGLVFRYNTPRTAQTLNYTFAANLFFRHGEANSYTNTLVYASRFVTSPTTQLSLGVVGTQGRLNTFIRDQDSGQTPLTALPAGGTSFVQGGVNQGFSKQFSPSVSVAEALGFLIYNPLTDFPQRTYNGTGSLAVLRAWENDTGSFRLNGAYTHFDNVATGEPGTTERLGRDQLITTLLVGWQHDYGRYFSHQLDLGISQATDLSGQYAQLYQPAALAALRYTREEVQAEAAYSHSAAPNVFLSQLALLDQATVRAAAPLSQVARLGAVGSLGVQVNQPIVNGTLGNAITLWLADLALLWVPVRRIPELELELRYQHVNQLAAASQIVRNSLTLSAVFTFPPDREPQMRIAMTQPFGGTQRERPRREEAPQENEEQEQQGQPAGQGE
ncbi:hypothetical protein [Chondromyces apiculatus]|uniref:Uncharacterized protein n=1 Tax=Chondromyces apiculatus DSM 436 TaxID=1192034 RepID=A0A017T1D9_9BACT|nr:hypothetical protein [Chondromyces apiculatus]EYF03039.1 Hypothetical protein CAP_6302 [Chondromyces apiculatus DSM 436]